MRVLDASERTPIASYSPLAELGAGRLAVTFLARGSDGGPVALKVVREQLLAEPGFGHRFTREAEAARPVTGAHVARVLASGEGWLAAEFEPGPTLTEALAQGPLPEDDVVRLGAGLARALAEIHRAGTVHRDLKPSNVLLSEGGVRVCDFGLARVFQGAVTPAYSAPEQIAGHAVTAACDVWAAGVLMLEAATGENPFAGSSVQAGYKVTNVEPDLSGVPPRLREAVGRCLRKDPARRPTPRRLLELIGPEPGGRPWTPTVHHITVTRRAEAETLLEAGLSAPPARAPDRPPPRRRTGLTVTIGAGLVAAVLITLALVMGGKGTPNGAPDVGDSSAPGESPTSFDAVHAGQCVVNVGGADRPDLRVVSCADGAFEVDKVVRAGETCDGPWNVTFPAEKVTVCLWYLHPNGDAYRAGAGDCVKERDGTWSRTECVTGEFSVVRRLSGTSDSGECRGTQGIDRSPAFVVEGVEALDVVLCLSMNYPDAMGHAPVGACLIANGKDGAWKFAFADDCAKANAVVTGRTPGVDTEGFCGGDGAVSWAPPRYPDLGYTVCFRWVGR